ncbi:MAG: pyridoxal 5'-phosphate synthase glutaminase subunit PdxT [Myxococcales bacterium]|nr:pyridoxal 5'-phosphate synthase glutaminase subunit PdxT [Myxococcales bacterium]
MSKTIGVLALQGGYQAHLKALDTCGYKTLAVREISDLRNLDGLVLPGGESTTQIKLMKRFGHWSVIDELVRSGCPTLATCAGLILAASHVTQPSQVSFGWLDMDVTRNGWGRQVHSGEGLADLESTRPHFGDDPLKLLFIRAPRIQRVGQRVDVLAMTNGEAVMVRQGALIAASFHPELTDDLRVHRLTFG